jgi:putative transposase
VEEGFEWGPDTIEAEIRERVRRMIEAIVEEELESTLGAGRSQRVGAARTGYRHGARERQLTTSLGQTTITLPRARLKGADGAGCEWHSQIIPRYQRRTERVDAALLGTISAASTRADCEEPYRHCCAERLYRRTRYRGWSGGCAMSSPHGQRAT